MVGAGVIGVGHPLVSVEIADTLHLLKLNLILQMVSILSLEMLLYHASGHTATVFEFEVALIVGPRMLDHPLALFLALLLQNIHP